MSPEIESQKVLKDLVVREVVGPAIGVGDGVVEIGVGVGQPSGSGIVEAGEGSFGVCGAPVFAESVQFAGGVGDGFALFGHWTGEWEGLEAGGYDVSGTAFCLSQLCSLTTRP